MKKIICLILCLAFSLMTLCACNSTYENSIIKHNYERDYSQVIVKIEPVTETVRVENGKEVTFTTEETNIYKYQLVNYINNYAGTYMNYYNWTYDQVVDYGLEQLVLTELVLTSADIMFETREIFWTQDDIDTIQQSVYSSLDGYYNDIYNEVLDKMGYDAIVTPDSSESSSETTYPVKEEETEEKDRFLTEEKDRIYGNNAKHDDWYLTSEWYIENDEYWNSLPGNYGDEKSRAVARESVKRLITMLYGNSQNIVGLNEDEKNRISEEVENLENMIKEDGAAYAYKNLGKTLLVKKLIGDNLILSQKMTILQECIESRVSVSDEEIVEKYNKLFAQQVGDFKNIDKYDTAVSDGDMILYRPNGNYVYVKHILIPFSEEQKAYLKSYKEISTEEEYIAERNREVNNIVAYEHVGGEDDKTRPLTVDQIWSEVKATMSRVSASAYDAERAFDDLIYKYNTDPGIFEKESGYAVKYKLDEDEDETYMVEFAEAARAFRDENYNVGEIYNEYVVTDYGVHIMYYASDYQGGEKLNLNDYTTPGRYTLVKDAIKEDLLETKIENEYNVWRDEKIQYYRNVNKIVNTIDSAFKDLYDEQ